MVTTKNYHCYFFLVLFLSSLVLSLSPSLLVSAQCGASYFVDFHDPGNPATTTCTPNPETMMEAKTTCNPQTAGNIPTTIEVKFANYSNNLDFPYGVCNAASTGQQTINFDLNDTAFPSDTRYIVTMAALSNVSSTGDLKAFISDGSFSILSNATGTPRWINLGVFDGNVNTKFMPLTSGTPPSQQSVFTPLPRGLGSGLEFPYPYNGYAMCNDTFSYQVWRVAGYGPILEVQFRSPRANLHVHGLSATTCVTTFTNAIANRDMTLKINATYVQLGGRYGVTTTSSTQASAFACETACRATSSTCRFFLWNPTTLECAMTTNLFGFKGSNVPPTATPVEFGQAFTKAPRVYGAVRKAGDATQRAKLSRPDLGYSGAFLVSRMAWDENQITSIPFTSLSQYKVSVAQAVFGSQLVSMWTDESSEQYGAGSLFPFAALDSNGQEDTSERQDGESHQCNKYYTTPSTRFNVGLVPRNLFLSIPIARNGQCGSTNLGSSAIVHYDGVQNTSVSYKYAFVNPTSLTSSFFATKHNIDASNIQSFESFSAAGGVLHTYVTSTVNDGSNFASSPSWKFLDSDNTYRTTSVLCQMTGSPGYNAQENTTAATGTYNCATYTTRAEIIAACEQDVNCIGFTLTVDGSFVENPGCLVTDSAGYTTGVDVASTLYIKNFASSNVCTIPTQGATTATIQVSNALPTAMFVIKGTATGTIATCNVSALAPPSSTTETACFSLSSCFSGSFSSADTSLTIELHTSSTKRQQCTQFAANVLVQFDQRSVNFEPNAACFADANVSSGCVAGADLGITNCNGARRLAGITIPASLDYCTPEGADSSIIYDIGSNPRNIFVVADLSQMTSANRQTGAVSVYALTATGSEYHLGYIFSNSSTNAVYSYLNGHAAVIGAPLCSTQTDQFSYNLGGAAAFSIPEAARTIGVTQIKISSGETMARIIRVTELLQTPSATCPYEDITFPIFYRAKDVMFKQTSRAVGFDAASTTVTPIASTSSVSDLASCADLCFDAADCKVWAFDVTNDADASGTCKFYASASGYTSTLAELGLAASVVGVRQLGDASPGRFPVRVASSSNQFFQTTFGASGVSTTAVLFALGKYDMTTGKQRDTFNFGISNAASIWVFTSDSGIRASGSTIGISSPLGVANCGGPTTATNQFVAPLAAEGTCGGSSNQLLACPPLSTASSTASRVKGSVWIKTIFNSTTSESCPLLSASNLYNPPLTWGMVVVQGDIKVVSYMSLEIRPSTYSFVPSSGNIQDEVESATVEGSSVKLRRYVSSTSGVATTSAPSLATHSSVICDIADLDTYDAMINTPGDPTKAYQCGTNISSLAEAMQKCQNDGTMCAGFTMQNSNRAPWCFFTVAPTTAGGSSAYTFWKKPAPFAGTCSFTVENPGVLRVSTTLRSLGADEGTVFIYVDGVLQKRCGDDQPFFDGSLASQNYETCDTYKLCFRGAIFANTGSTVEIKFRRFKSTNQQFSRPAGCRQAYSALVQYTVADSGIIPYYKGASASLGQRHYLRLTGSKRESLIYGYGMTSFATFVLQDRYACFGACTTPYQIETYIDDSAVRSICGGTLGFADSPVAGQSSQCTKYKYCGSASPSGTGTYLPNTFSPANGGKLARLYLEDETIRNVTNCDSTSDLFWVFLSNGITVGAQEGSSDFRMNRVITATSTSDISADNLTSGRQFQLLKTQFPAINNYDMFGRYFKVTYDNDLLPSLGYYPFFNRDSPSDKDLFGTPTNPYMSCIIPKTFDGETIVTGTASCTTKVTGNWVKILVAQTSFAGFTQTVTVQMGAKKYTCGGDYRFFGFAGLSGKCNNYYTCYEGPAHDTHVTLTFSKDVDGSTSCDYRAVALVKSEDKVIPSQQTCTSADPFVCSVEGTCLTLNQICDGNTDCADVSDESSCSNWNYVETNLVPSCVALTNATLASSAQCQRLALAKNSRSFTYNTKTSFCEIFDCVVFDNPNLNNVSSTAAANGDIDYYIQTADPDAFRYCTAPLHCSNAGTPTNNVPPCGCVCDSLYVGDRCDSIRQVSIIGDIYVVFPAGTSITSSITVAIVNAFSLELLNVDSVVTTGKIVNLANGTAVQVGIKTSLGGQSTDVYNMMPVATRKRLLNTLSSTGATLITATGVVGEKATVTCNIANLSSTADPSCTLQTDINSTKSIAIKATSVTINTPDQFISVSVYDGSPTARRAGATPLKTITCNSTNFVRTTNPTLSGTCGVSNDCQIYLDDTTTSAIYTKVSVSPTFNPDGDTCQGRDVESAVTVEGNVFLPDGTSAGPIAYKTAPNSGLQTGAIVLFIIGFIFLVIAVIYYTVLKKRYVDPPEETAQQPNATEEKLSHAVSFEESQNMSEDERQAMLDENSNKKKSASETPNPMSPKAATSKNDDGELALDEEAEDEDALGDLDEKELGEEEDDDADYGADGGEVQSGVWNDDPTLDADGQPIKKKKRNIKKKHGLSDADKKRRADALRGGWLRYLGVAAIALFFICFFLGGVLFALYIGSEESIYSHYLIIEEYRDEQCSDSELASLPIRLSYVAVNDECNMINVVGAAQGAAYVGAMASAGDASFISVRSGGSEDRCDSAKTIDYSLRTCLEQETMFPLKDAKDRLYMKLFLMPVDEALKRIEALKVYNPEPALNAETTVEPLTNAERYDRTYAYHTYQKNGQFNSVPVPVRTEADFLLIQNASLVSPTVRTQVENGNEPPELVRFRATYDGDNIDSSPRLSNGIDGDFTPIGTLFNGYKSTTTSNVEPYTDAVRYYGIAGSEWDIARQDSKFTITFWLSATNATTGIALAISDNWQVHSSTATGAGSEIPPLTRLTEVLENGEETTSWYSDWVVSGAVYVHGPSKTIRFVFADMGGDVQQVQWDTSKLGVVRMFDGGWHFISMIFERSDNDVTVDALLVVDGETSYIKEGWRLCLADHVPSLRSLSAGDTVRVLNSRDEDVITGGLLTIGHFNGGIWAPALFPEVMPLQRLAGIGAPGMEKFSGLEVQGSLALAIVMLIVSIFILFFTIYEIWHHFFAVDVNKLLLQNGPAVRKDHNGQALRDGFPDNVATPTIIVLVHFIQPVIGTAQNMALYFDGWSWPPEVVDFYNIFYKILVLDPFNNVKGFPTLLLPVVLFVAAVAVLFIINFLAIQDEESFAKVIEEYQSRCEVQDPFKMKHLEEGRPKPVYYWVVYDAENNDIKLDEEQEEIVQKEVNALLTRVERRQQNARVYSQAMCKFPGVGDGIMLYERRNGRIGVFFRIAPDPEEFYIKQPTHMAPLSDAEKDAFYEQNDQVNGLDLDGTMNGTMNGTLNGTMGSTFGGTRNSAANKHASKFTSTLLSNRGAAAAADKSTNNRGAQSGVFGGTMNSTFHTANDARLARLAAGDTYGNQRPSTRTMMNLTARGQTRTRSSERGAGGQSKDDANKLLVTQIALECRTDNAVCPLHGNRLVRTPVDGLSCVHSDTPYYGAVKCDANQTMYQCTHPECYYAVCEGCFTNNREGVAAGALNQAIAALAEIRRKGFWRIVKAAVILSSLVLYLPVVRNAAMVLFCHPYFLCEFGSCWSKPSITFVIFVFIAITSVVLVGFGYIVQQMLLLNKRYKLLLDVLPVFPIIRKWKFLDWLLPTTNIMEVDYDRFLYVDETLLKTLYEPHGFTLFWFTPAWLVAKACCIIALVGSTPNSLAQLATISTIEAVYSLIVTFLSPFKNKWVNGVARMSLLWMLLTLALMALHRVDIANNINSSGYASQMISLAIVFWALVGVCIVAAIVEPLIDQRMKERSRIKELGDLNEEIEIEMARKREKRAMMTGDK